MQGGGHIHTIQDATAVVLCGGKSSRMGFDKAFLKLRGHSLLSCNARRLSQMFERVVLASNDGAKLEGLENLAEYRVLVDRLPGCGPLGAIVTALAQCETPYIFVTACDMPFLRVDLIERMWCAKDTYQAVVCEHADHLEPLFAFYHHSCLEVFEKQLREKRLRIRQDFALLKILYLSLSAEEAEDAFANINTPQDYERWLASAQDEDIAWER